ncbi:MAG: 3-hydroxyacyl-CoA dehydrogenase [Deltaproteobacteria bacterium]|nr:MAG: 3-hydroxyacyl-CoA dehydrogenase [Deltaproteobacteria bacterium]
MATCADSPVAVIGAGLTGASWAALFTSHGLRVRLHDKDPDALGKGLQRAQTYVHFLIDHGMTDRKEAEAGLAALQPCEELSDAVQDTVFVQESVYENYEIKCSVFEAVDRHAPRHALIATSSSGLSISRIQEAARYPDRCLAGHPYNPPHLIPLVELAPGEKTAKETVAAARRFYEGVGKRPVILNRAVPGYLANRMSAALWREAINLVLDGVASVADVDRAISLGPGLRWAVMGPHLIYHLGGGEGGIRYHVEHLRAAKEEIWQDLNDWQDLPWETATALEQGLPELEALESLTRKRDEILVQILKALQSQLKEKR